MLKVEDYAKIRLAHREGMSIREIARTFGHSRVKVREILSRPLPKPYTRSRPPAAPVLGPFTAVIDSILAQDEFAPPKQRHTAMQVFRRLRDEHHYTGGYDQVRRYIASTGRCRRETFIPLQHDPGVRLEADFGVIHVDFPQGRRPVDVLLCVWSYSNYPFALALPTQRTEAILKGMVRAFSFFGCVPREVWWDNPKTVVKKIFKGRQRTPNDHYLALASHYRFDPLFCMPRRGNEKPRVENRVRVLQRQWATPVPAAKDLDDFNAYLHGRCRAEAEHTVAGQQEAIGLRFDRDRSCAAALPAFPFDPCVTQPAVVDKYQTVRFDCNRYSVPRTCAFLEVSVKGYVDRVEVVHAGSVVARHARSYGQAEQVLDPLHYLTSLQRRPAALDHAPVLRDWNLPESFTRLRAGLEARHGPNIGARHYIRVLLLLAEYPLTLVRRAVEGALDSGEVRVERVIASVLRQARKSPLSDAAEAVTGECHTAREDLKAYQVPRPDLSRFDQLLNEGGHDERE